MKHYELFEAKLVEMCLEQEIGAFAFVWMFSAPDGIAIIKTAATDQFGMTKEAKDELASEINKVFENWLIKHKVVSE